MSVLSFKAANQRELIENLVVRDIKARYKQSLLGYAWAVLNPLSYAVIYTIVGQYILKQDTHIPFPVFSYYGLLFWNLFSSGLASASESLIAHLSLITKVYFPREVFPISAAASKIVDFAFGLVGIIPLLIAFHVVPSPRMILILPLLAITVLFTTGVGMLCACANLFYRDVRYLVTMTTNLLAFLVPNMYPLEKIPDNFRTLYLLNPMAVIIEASRRVTFHIEGDAGRLGPLLPYLGISVVTSLVFFVLGYAVFKHYEPRFAESI